MTAVPCRREAGAAEGSGERKLSSGGGMKSVSMERPAVDAIIAAEKRGTLVAYLSYALKDVRTLDFKAYQLLQLTIESLGGGDEDLAQTH
jgi:hypothetical protein